MTLMMMVVVGLLLASAIAVNVYAYLLNRHIRNCPRCQSGLEKS